MRATVLAVSLAVCVGGAATPSRSGAALSPATRQAFDRYVQLTEARLAAEARGGAPFL